MGSLFRKKPLSMAIQQAHDPLLEEGNGLKRSLGAFNITMLGVGGIIGAGIFSLTGIAAAEYAGPGIVFSFMIGGILCLLAGLCYAEMASMVPVAGSAYAYSYSTMGEFIAWIIGWDLILEYTFGAVTVASSWSGYFVSLITKTLGIPISDTLLLFTKGPFEQIAMADGTTAHGIINAPAMFVALLATSILYRGIKESAWVNNIIVLIKVFIIAGFIIIGWGVVDSANWFVNLNAKGLMQLIPEPALIMQHGREVLRYGLPGVLTGAGVVFFAYIGFDAVSTTAQEAKNPQRDLPIGILGSLAICTLLYILMALALTGVVHYKELAVPDPVAVGIDRIVQLRNMSETMRHVLSFGVKLGALAGLTSVIIVLMLGQTRIFYAMSKDGLLPWFKDIHKKYQTPHKATMVTGLFVALFAGFLPMTLVGELVSIGTLLAFVLVCVGIPILRKTAPDIHRPFKVPLPWVVAPAGAIACLWVMTGLPHDTWLRLSLWLIIGIVIYFTYSRHHSRLNK